MRIVVETKIMIDWYEGTVVVSVEDDVDRDEAGDVLSSFDEEEVPVSLSCCDFFL